MRTLDAEERLQVRVVGIVQGVGFRPFVFRIANELELAGWIRNDESGVTIEVEGSHPQLLTFIERLQREKPAHAYIYAIDHRFLSPAGLQNFTIESSESKGRKNAWVLPDLAVCAQCSDELFDPENRRFRYPFINCTHCGPRYTIIEGVPYDRPLTSMKIFRMCKACAEEYDDPFDRRFHAQPNACSACGPRLQYIARNGSKSCFDEEALKSAERKILEGGIVAVKGLGGFHLVFDARNQSAALTLRRRKNRQNKPFAVMFPTLDLLRQYVAVDSFTESVLLSAQAPIVLLQRKRTRFPAIAKAVAPHSPYLGVYLPYAPLHLLLLHDLGFPVVATSGNRTDEPIAYKDEEAGENLPALCDGILTHDRPIVHHADDSVMHIVVKPDKKPQMLRRARGYTPLPVLAPVNLPPLLALGGQMNSTFAISRKREIILSPHLGDMDSYEARETFKRTLRDYLALYEVTPEAVVRDLHPDYFTTHLAGELQIPQIAVQHHHAHMAACMLENQIAGPALALTWDGTGYGPDHTVWGGEFLFGDAGQFQRIASLRPFLLPGGEKAIHETWRTALSLLRDAFPGELPRDLPLFEHVSSKRIDSVLTMLDKRILSPATTSMGRLFDGMSAILGLSYANTHQAESAQLLEYAAWRNDTPTDLLPFLLDRDDIIRIDWRETVRAVVARLRAGEPAELLSAAFHCTVAEAAHRVIDQTETEAVALAGGVFCNRYLTEQLLSSIHSGGRRGYIHTQLPPTDGSLAAGQLWVAAHQLQM